MIFFGRRAIREAEALGERADELKAENKKRIDRVTDKSNSLHNLLKTNDITLRVSIHT